MEPAAEPLGSVYNSFAMSRTNRTSDGSHPIWFPAKRYGWGWGLPIAWQGWVVMAIWFVVVITGASFLAGRHWVAYVVFMLVMVGVLTCICYAKGEAPRWRWGK
jgi:hypothetical protein